MKKICCLLFALATVSVFALDITALDGKTYKNVTVLNETPVGFDIMCKLADGTPAVINLKFTDLPAEIQKKYNYNPLRAADFDRKVVNYRQMEYKKARAEAKKKHREQQLYARQQNREFKTFDDIQALLQAHRRKVTLRVIRSTDDGSLCYSSAVISTVTSDAPQIFVFGEVGSDGDSWDGYIYPVGGTVTLTEGVFPAWDISLPDAVDIIINSKEDQDFNQKVEEELSNV